MGTGGSAGKGCEGRGDWVAMAEELSYDQIVDGDEKL